MVAPYRHAKLSATKLAGDSNNPLRIRDDATADELRAEIMRHLAVLVDGGILDLEPMLAPKRGIAKQPGAALFRLCQLVQRGPTFWCQIGPPSSAPWPRHMALFQQADYAMFRWIGWSGGPPRREHHLTREQKSLHLSSSALKRAFSGD
jgi:hypothetical protein